MSQSVRTPVRKDRVIEAALTLFANEGYHGVSVPRIAKAARVGISSIYKVAESKEALGQLIFEDVVESLVQNVFLSVELGSYKDQNELFRAYWVRLTEWIQSKPERARFMMLYKFVAPDIVQAQLKDQEAIESLAERLEELGSFRNTDARVFLSVIVGPVAFLVLDAKRQGDIEPDRFRSLGDLVLGMLQQGDAPNS